jgi:hypothetical protein
MIISFTLNLIIYFSILGYSFLLKKIFDKKNRFVQVNNFDFLYGVFFLILISIVLNFFFPLKIFFTSIILLGFIFFLYLLFKKKLNINIFIFSVILFFFIFINYENGHNIDSPVYHTQTIRWAYDKKIVFGLSNLDWLYSLNSGWHILLSLLKFKIKGFDTIYLLNFLPLTVLFYQIYLSVSKNYLLSEICIFLVGIYLIFFSIIHPFQNGIIFNHLGNPEVDTVAMLLFISSFYFFLKFNETEETYYFDLLLISSVLCVITKITYIGISIFTLYVLFKKIDLIKKSFIPLIFSTFLVALWMLRNFILTSCFIYPVKISCLNTSWFFGSDRIDLLVNATKGFSRDTRLRERYLEFDHTIYSFDWFMPWFQDYFLNTSLLKISYSMLLISILVLSFLYLFGYLKDYILKKDMLVIIILSFFLNNYFWMQAPEIRFGWGHILFFPCLVLGYVLINLKFFKIFINRNYSLFLLLILMAFSVGKNFNNLNFNNLTNNYKQDFDYLDVSKLGVFNGYEIYVSDRWQCADYNRICINSPKDDYLIIDKYGYTFFLK